MTLSPPKPAPVCEAIRVGLQEVVGGIVHKELRCPVTAGNFRF